MSTWFINMLCFISNIYTGNTETLDAATLGKWQLTGPETQINAPALIPMAFALQMLRIFLKLWSSSFSNFKFEFALVHS